MVIKQKMVKGVTAMIDGMQEYIGRTIKEECLKEIKPWLSQTPNGYYCLTTRPDDCGPKTHINMFIYFDEAYRVVDFDGNKCYSYYSGMYNRSASVREGNWTKKDIAYLRRYVKEITE